MHSFRILIADDHLSVRRELRKLLSGHSGWAVIAEAIDGRDALARARELLPDLILLDIGMPYINGLEAAHQILNELPQTKILMITVHANRHAALEARSLGVRGLCSKTDATRELRSAVETIEQGGSYFPVLETSDLDEDAPDEEDLFLRRTARHRRAQPR